MQTVYQTQTDKAKVCFVVVPPYLPDTLYMDFSPLSDRWLLCYATLYECTEDDFKNEINNEVEKLPEGEWRLIGPLSEVSEEQAARIVDYTNVSSPCPCEYCGYDIDCYRDYQEQTKEDWEKYPTADSLRSALDSFRSLGRALGIPEGQNIVVLAEFIS